MKKTYISEKMVAFHVAKLDAEGKKIPILNDFGNPKPGEFEELRENFTAFEIKKNTLGEQVRTYIYIVDENTLPEVAKEVEKLLNGGLCELQEDYIKRTNKEQYHALAELKKVKAEADEKVSTMQARVDEMEKELEELRKKRKSKE